MKIKLKPPGALLNMHALLLIFNIVSFGYGAAAECLSLVPIMAGFNGAVLGIAVWFHFGLFILGHAESICVDSKSTLGTLKAIARVLGWFGAIASTIFSVV